MARRKSRLNPLIMMSVLLVILIVGAVIIMLRQPKKMDGKVAAKSFEGTSSSKLIALPIPIAVITPVPIPTLKIYQPIDHYNPPMIPVNPAYTLIFVGDSMTESLGINFDDLRIDLKKYYPGKIFGLFNYGFGSTNILSVENRLNHDTLYQGINYRSILGRGFDIIFIESMGNNPLSQFPIEQGLKRQSMALDYMVAEIVDTHPSSLIVFVATVAPSQELYGKGAVELSPKARIQWANERRAYIENHINYAKSHNIPLINVYEKTLNKNGVAMLKYLNPNNYIHPSFAGISLISQMIADFVFKNKILLN